MNRLSIVILGLSITSSWGNGHATTYRALVRELVRRGHEVLFLERNKPWYAANRDLPAPLFGRTALYENLAQLHREFTAAVRDADLVMVGSYVPEGKEVGRWVMETAGGVTAFYDIDTPVTLAKLSRGEEEYLSAELIPHYDLYLSFTGGPTLRRLENEYGSPCALPFYCSVDPESHAPEPVSPGWDLGYLGTYSPDRQPRLEQLLLQPATFLPAAKFVVAGPGFPAPVVWPANVDRIAHLAPGEHRRFYNGQRFTLNITRADMVQAGWSPSVRLFEAAACGIPVISDWWEGLDEIFEPEREILIAHSGKDILFYLQELGEEKRKLIGARARKRIMSEHTASHRVLQLENYLIPSFKLKPAGRAAN
jgi:spore maturation protein CgeB